MKSKRIIASFSSVKLSQKEKDDILDAILTRADYEKKTKQRRSTMKKKSFWKYAVSIAAAAIVVCGAVVLYPMLSNKTNTPEEHNASTQSTQSPAPTKIQEQAAGGDSDYIKWYTGLELKEGAIKDFTQPDSIDIATSTPVFFEDEAIDEVVKRLKNAGWSGIYHEKDDAHAAVFLKQPETYEWNNDKEGIFEATEEHIALACKFISDSGLAELIKQETGIELSSQPTNEAEALVFRGYYNGCRTETYVSLYFSPDGTMTEMKMYAVKLNPVVSTSEIIPIEDAVKKTFIFIETGYGQIMDDRIAVSSVEIVYYDGIPFYRFACENNSDMFGQLYTLALAVSYDDIIANPDILAVYESLMKNGIWQ